MNYVGEEKKKNESRKSNKRTNSVRKFSARRNYWKKYEARNKSKKINYTEKIMVWKKNTTNVEYLMQERMIHENMK